MAFVLKCKRKTAQVILDHINSIEPKHMKLIIGKEENSKLAVLDLESNVNRKRKKMEFSMHYKKKNTSISIKKQFGYRESIKKE